MKKKLLIKVTLLLSVVLLTACSNKELLSKKIDISSIDKIQVVTAMGNPAYGADSKIIKDVEEIKSLVKTFNSATVEKKVKDDDIGVAATSNYYFYHKNQLIHKLSFNGNNTQIVWFNDDYFYVEYGEGQTIPFEQYKSSKSDIIIVDENLNEIERPKE